jgi:hypothetical protein
VMVGHRGDGPAARQEGDADLRRSANHVRERG